MVDYHATRLRGTRLGNDRRTAPLILQRIDQDFLEAVLGEIASESGRTRTAATSAGQRDGAGTLRLFQPVHRTFHPVLLEAVCDRFGEPRLDPREIDSAGMMVRRIAPDAREGRAGREGWMKSSGGEMKGWIAIPEVESRLDPDFRRRPSPVRAGLPALTAMLPQLRRSLDGLEESVSPLFVAPPATCAAAGKTLLFGLVPVTSAERSESPLPLEPSSEDVEAILPGLLRRGTRTLNPGDEERVEPAIDDLSLLTSLGVFEPEGEGRALFQELNRIEAWIQRPLNVRISLKLGDELKRAAGVFLDPAAARRNEPFHWTISVARERAIADLLGGMMRSQLAALAPGSQRFDPRGDTYELHAFIRVRQGPNCPPKLVWCDEPSEPFTIAPWYETGNAPPIPIVLPDITDRQALKQMKPNVAFITPNALAEKLRNTKVGKLIQGEGPPAAPAVAFDWVCSFNIPIITICAFIVLYIFLTLLNIVFWWLPFVKVCFPIPRRSG